MNFLTPAISFFVALDPKLQEIIAWAIGIIVAYVLLQIANVPALKWLSDYLGAYKVGIVVWLTNLVVQFIQAQLNKIPMTWDAVVILVMQLIVAVVVTLTSFALIRARAWAGHKALLPSKQ